MQVDDAAASPLVPCGWADRLDLGAVLLVGLGPSTSPWGLLAADAPRSTGEALGVLAAMRAAASALLDPAAWKQAVGKRVSNHDPSRLLTPTQLTALWLLSQHYTQAEVAAMLFVSLTAVKKLLPRQVHRVRG